MVIHSSGAACLAWSLLSVLLSNGGSHSSQKQQSASSEGNRMERAEGYYFRTDADQMKQCFDSGFLPKWQCNCCVNGNPGGGMNMGPSPGRQLLDQSNSILWLRRRRQETKIDFARFFQHQLCAYSKCLGEIFHSMPKKIALNLQVSWSKSISSQHLYWPSLPEQIGYNNYCRIHHLPMAAWE